MRWVVLGQGERGWADRGACAGRPAETADPPSHWPQLQPLQVAAAAVKEPQAESRTQEGGGTHKCTPEVGLHPSNVIQGGRQLTATSQVAGVVGRRRFLISPTMVSTQASSQPRSFIMYLRSTAGVAGASTAATAATTRTRCARLHGAAVKLSTRLPVPAQQELLPHTFAATRKEAAQAQQLEAPRDRPPEHSALAPRGKTLRPLSSLPPPAHLAAILTSAAGWNARGLACRDTLLGTARCCMVGMRSMPVHQRLDLQCKLDVVVNGEHPCQWRDTGPEENPIEFPPLL